MKEEGGEREVVTPGEVLGKASDVRAGRGAYLAPHNNLVYASLTGFRRTLSPSPDSLDQVLLLFHHQISILVLFLLFTLKNSINLAVRWENIVRVVAYLWKYGKTYIILLFFLNRLGIEFIFIICIS